MATNSTRNDKPPDPDDPVQQRLRARLSGETAVIPRQLRRKKKRESPESIEERRKNLQASARRRMVRKTRVPLVLSDPHPLIEITRKALENPKADEFGRLIPRKKRCLPITVSAGTLNRALLVMDTLLKAMQSSGYTPELVRKGGPGVFVVVDGERLEFGMAECIGRREHKPTEEELKKKKDDILGTYKWPKWEEFLEGGLQLAIHYIPAGPKTTWSDGKRWIVEDCIDAFIRTLPKAAQRLKEERAQHDRSRRECEARERAYQEKQKQKAERADRFAEEQALVEKLGVELGRWQRAGLIRDYIYKMEKAFAPPGTVMLPEGEMDKWLRWCRAYADILDPGVTGTGTPVEADSRLPMYDWMNEPDTFELATERMRRTASVT